MNCHDSDTADYHRSHGGSGNNDHAVSALCGISSGKTHPKIYSVSRTSSPQAAVFALLIVYSLKDVTIFSGSHGIPEAIGIAAVVALHVWKRQMLLSIAGGTILYMLLVQFVF